MQDRQRKFAPVALSDRFFHGEIICQLVQSRQRLETIGAAEIILDSITHPFAVILTQDCDLESDHRARLQGGTPASLLPNILFCEAMLISQFKGGIPPGKDIWKRIVQNKDERYHCLESVPHDVELKNEGIGSLGMDFKRYFTIPTDEVYRCVEIGRTQRRCKLLTPYAEQLLDRFFHFQARIPVPENHDVESA